MELNLMRIRELNTIYAMRQKNTHSSGVVKKKGEKKWERRASSEQFNVSVYFA